MSRKNCDQPERSQRKLRHALLTLSFWAIFASGIAIEVLAPGLRIENHAFVMPPAALQQGAQIRPDALVDHERRMQWTAGILTIGGALALAFWNRRTLANALLLPRSFDLQDR
ncbi:MAG: hypothetical protein WBV55_06290 [Candidatus Sulfotelmatobacter sp.]